MLHKSGRGDIIDEEDDEVDGERGKHYMLSCYTRVVEETQLMRKMMKWMENEGNITWWMFFIMLCFLKDYSSTLNDSSSYFVQIFQSF
ncbi:hypothetical protein MtrunA17_Chr4g0026131 [Medicago truncatula]|uniref:Uncharacterized protein n=1 Tax=Medicago truncatula TaxID=3880 RepID=A0A396ICA7_MEDTR|nr:hypothetical protein MtrunA17_Chr4g0026131 [Medicago truncatula]